MAEMVITLGSKNLKDAAKSLKELARVLRDDVPTDIEQAIGTAVAGELTKNVSSLHTYDGNYDGASPVNVVVMPDPVAEAHRTAWIGSQIKFIEFGTGAPGAASGYPGPGMTAAGYSPDSTKDQWWYLDARLGPWVSLGIPASAPMWNAALAVRGMGLGSFARRPIGRALDDAVQHSR